MGFLVEDTLWPCESPYVRCMSGQPARNICSSERTYIYIYTYTYVYIYIYIYVYMYITLLRIAVSKATPDTGFFGSRTLIFLDMQVCKHSSKIPQSPPAQGQQIDLKLLVPGHKFVKVCKM